MVTELFERAFDDIMVIMASYPKLLGLVLTVPHLGVEVVSAVKSETLKKEYKDTKVIFESESGKYQYESIIL